jgi:hypothetical protein
MYVVKVAGTHDWNPQETTHERWWQRNSRFTQKLKAHGYEHVGWDVAGQEIPQWSCALSGTFFAGRDLRTWWRGAFSLASQLIELPLVDRNIIAHSHGGNVAVLAVVIMNAKGEPVSRLITVCAPVRRDMVEFYKLIKCPWRHIYSREMWRNRMQWMGSRVRLTWEMPGKVENFELGGIGHSDLLREPDRFPDEIEEGIVGFLPQVKT